MKVKGPLRCNKKILLTMVKFTFSKKATQNDEIFTVDLTFTTSTVKISSIFVAFLENMNFTFHSKIISIN